MLRRRLTTAWITSKFSNSAVLLSQAYAALQAKLSISRAVSTTSSASTSTACILASAAAAVIPQTVRHPDCNFFRTSCTKILNSTPYRIKPSTALNQCLNSQMAPFEYLAQARLFAKTFNFSTCNMQLSTPWCDTYTFPIKPMTMRPLPIHVITTSERIAHPPKAARYATSLPPNFDAALRDQEGSPCKSWDIHTDTVIGLIRGHKLG